ncbi:hypothetical protein [Apibacter sp. HY039]|uniref:hypothetical protein n=1 Tax=Apibacter sp. HY039 TaxID=2501476 RepID=UPI000FEBEC16|nr:hypothetical protein [Apibacter sp. HY039]
MKVAFALTAHYPDDERVYYQQALALKEKQCDIHIISSRLDKSLIQNCYCFNDKDLPKKKVIKKIAFFLSIINPDVIICDTPIAILAASNYKKTNKTVRIIYDVTEWYPTKNTLHDLSYLKKTIKATILFLLLIYSSSKVNNFIFGEYYKSIIFKILYPFKKYMYLPYYSDTSLIPIYKFNDISKECALFYAGNLTKDKGFNSVMDISIKLALKHPNIKFRLNIISNTSKFVYTKKIPENLKIEKNSQLPFLIFCKEIGKNDFFLDLREPDFYNSYSLPIKIFYYMAAGRPVIYSKLKAIQNYISEINQIGYIESPNNINKIIDKISYYIHNQSDYQKDGLYARKLALSKYDWKLIKPNFINFIID